MAKKRKTRITRSRRRISGTAGMSNVLVVVGGAILGGVGARMLATSVGAGIQPQLKAIGEIAAGAYVAANAEHPFMKGVGIGIATEGATFFAQKMGVIKGVDDDEYAVGDLDELSGVNYDLPEISGPEDDEI